MPKKVSPGQECDLVCLREYLDLVAVIVFDSAIAGVGVLGEDKS